MQVALEVGHGRIRMNGSSSPVQIWPVKLSCEGRELSYDYVGGVQGGRPTLEAVLSDILIKSPRRKTHSEWFALMGSANGHEYAQCQRRTSELAVLLGRSRFERMHMEFDRQPLGSMVPFRGLA